MRLAWLAFLACSGVDAASGQATSSGLAVKLVAEVEMRSIQGGQEIVKLVPAEKLVPGDEVVYTLEIRNVSPFAIPDPTVAIPVPVHTVYVPDSASGPGAQVSYSVDGGHTFDRPENLRVGEAGNLRSANPSDYTHLRWKLKNILKPKSVAFARFRAAVQ